MRRVRVFQICMKLKFDTKLYTCTGRMRWDWKAILMGCRVLIGKRILYANSRRSTGRKCYEFPTWCKSLFIIQFDISALSRLMASMLNGWTVRHDFSSTGFDPIRAKHLISHVYLIQLRGRFQLCKCKLSWKNWTRTTIISFTNYSKAHMVVDDQNARQHRVSKRWDCRTKSSARY